MTSWESLQTWSRSAPDSLAILSLTIRASYSVPLFIVGILNVSRTPWWFLLDWSGSAQHLLRKRWRSHQHLGPRNLQEDSFFLQRSSGATMECCFYSEARHCLGWYIQLWSQLVPKPWLLAEVDSWCRTLLIQWPIFAILSKASIWWRIALISWSVRSVIACLWK